MTHKWIFGEGLQENYDANGLPIRKFGNYGGIPRDIVDETEINN